MIIIINISILYFTQLAHTDDLPSTGRPTGLRALLILNLIQHAVHA